MATTKWLTRPFQRPRNTSTPRKQFCNSRSPRKRLRLRSKNSSAESLRKAASWDTRKQRLIQTGSPQRLRSKSNSVRNLRCQRQRRFRSLSRKALHGLAETIPFTPKLFRDESLNFEAGVSVGFHATARRPHLGPKAVQLDSNRGLVVAAGMDHQSHPSRRGTYEMAQTH